MFLIQNNLGLEHVGTIVDFIQKNTNAMQIDITSPSQDTQMVDEVKIPPALIPLLKPLRFVSLEAQVPLQKRIGVIQQQLKEAGDPVALPEEDAKVLNDLGLLLKEIHRYHVSRVQPYHLDLILRLYSWPPEHHFMGNSLPSN
jgi:hypothetical protein